MNKLQEIYETKVRILSENKDSNVMNVMVPFIQADEKNQNGRSYPKALLQREISRVQGSVQKGSFIGVGDHPLSGLADIATASHIVTKLSLDEKGKGTAELRILPTVRGKSIQTLIHNNATLGVSIRGFGTIGKDGRVADDYQLVGLDVVMNPSFKDSVFDKSNIFESQNFEEEANENLEKQINELEKESWLSACESGYSGSQEDWEKQYGSNLREAMGLPKAEGRETPVQKLTEGQIKDRTYSYFCEAVQSGFKGDFAIWKKKFPQIVESASKVKIVETKKEKKAPIKLRTNWNEVVASGFIGTREEFREKYPQIELVMPPSPQEKVVVEKILTKEALRQEAGRIFAALSADRPSQLTLEDVVRMLEKEELANADKRIRRKAIAIVSRDLDGTLGQDQIEKMVAKEIENLKEERRQMRERNWNAYRRLL